MEKCNTERGLYFLIIGLIITTAYSIITSLTNAIIQDTTTSIILGLFSIAALIGAIITLIGAILFFMGRKEFGKKHEKNVMKALYLVIISIVVSIVLAVLLVFMTFSAAMGSSPGALSSSTSSFNGLGYSIIFFVTALITAVLGGLIYYFGLIELEDDRGRTILIVGIIASVAISAFTSIYVAGLLGELFGSISVESSNFSSFAFNQNIGLVSILGVIPSLLFLYSFYIPYKRIKDGELVPVRSSTSQNVPSRVCPNCGRGIPNDAVSCPYCGKRFETFL